MQTPLLYALDFDGVICDSAVETGLAGWKAARTFWPDMPEAVPVPLSEAFRQARPVLETGYEAILIMRLLFQGTAAQALLDDFSAQKQVLLASENLDIATLKQLFSVTRDTWIQDNLSEWLAMNPLYPGVANKLQALGQRGDWYILTTKQERFALEILRANQVDLPAPHVFGMERNKDKDTILLELMQVHPEAQVIFVEDRLPALLSVKNHAQLQSVTLQLAGWGFNTAVDRAAAVQAGVRVLALDEFLLAAN